MQIAKKVLKSVAIPCQLYLELSKAARQEGIPDQEVSLSIFGNEVNIGRDSYAGSIIASKVVAETNLTAHTIISRDVDIGPSSQIDSLVIQDRGKPSLGDSSYVDELIIGRGVNLIFGKECAVDDLYCVERPSYKSAAGLQLYSVNPISYERFLRVVSSLSG